MCCYLKGERETDEETGTADREIQRDQLTKASLAAGTLQYSHILWCRNMKSLLFLLCASLSAAALVKREAEPEAEPEPAYGFDVNGGEIWPKYINLIHA